MWGKYSTWFTKNWTEVGSQWTALTLTRFSVVNNPMWFSWITLRLASYHPNRWRGLLLLSRHDTCGLCPILMSSQTPFLEPPSLSPQQSGYWIQCALASSLPFPRSFSNVFIIPPQWCLSLVKGRPRWSFVPSLIAQCLWLLLHEVKTPRWLTFYLFITQEPVCGLAPRKKSINILLISNS